MKRIVFYLFLLNIGVLTSCVQEFDADLPYSDQGFLVVEGDIIANSDVVFTFSKTFSLSEDGLPEDYNDIKATVYVVGSDGYRSEAGIETEKGKYKVSVGALNDDATYWVEILYNGDTYQSSPEKPLYTPPIDSISFHQIGYGDIDMRVSTHDATPEKQYYIWTFVEDWEIVSRYYVDLLYIPERNTIIEITEDPYYYCWNKYYSDRILIGSTESLSENRIINKVIQTIASTSNKVQTLYCMTLKQRAISKEAYNFYENKLKQSEEMGGLFTPQPSELPSNIMCVTNSAKKAIGYVGVAKNVSSYRRFVSSKELELPGYDTCLEPTENFSGYEEYYYAGFRPVNWKEPNVAFWIEVDCADCRTKGTKEKPSFWPNDHK